MSMWVSTKLILIVHAVLLLVFMPKSECGNDVIDQTCKQTPDYNLCISTLKSVSRSATADVKGLALIVVDKLKAKSTETLNQINALLRTSIPPKTKQALSFCADEYNAILKADVPVANEALTKGNYKFAEDSTTDAANEAVSCERGFSGKSSSPLSAQNKAVHDLASVGSAIVRQLL